MCIRILLGYKMNFGKLIEGKMTRIPFFERKKRRKIK